jgi:FeS assembly SUF system protein
MAEIKTEETKTEETKTEDIKVDKAELNNSIVEALKSCYDPEIPVNIYELGLIYTISISDDGKVEIEMTLTSPACPVAGTLPPEVAERVKAIPGVTDCKVNVVWEPQWGMHMMSEEAKLQLNLY